mgnify:CR=1 FL=1
MNKNYNISEAVAQAQDLAKKLSIGLSKVIRGRDDTIKFIITALFADGHILLEDYPGSGKTTLTKTLGRLISKDPSLGSPASQEHIIPFRRIQFTPDLLPGDVLGVNVFEPKSGSFRFIHGPVFAHVVLADELNRAGPKVQSAFLECMAEKQVTIDNYTHKLDELFFVIGTQNPLDIAGTYPLPIVQLDRFLFKIPMSYVDKKTEMEILSDYEQISSGTSESSPICSRAEILLARSVVNTVQIAPAIIEAIVDICQATRKAPNLQFGASTRAALMTQSAVRAWALVNGRSYATEDDLVAVLPYVLGHRLKFHGSVTSPREALMDIARPALEKLAKVGI